MVNRISFIDVDLKIRSREIFIASILCHYTLGIKLYKHHKISLSIIFVFLLISLFLEIFEMVISDFDIPNIIVYLILQIMLSIYRVFYDISVKYLMEYNYLNPYKILGLTNILDIFLISFFFFRKMLEMNLKI